MKEEKNQPNIIDTRSRLRRTAYYSLATRASRTRGCARSCVLARNMWSVTHEGIVRAKSLRPRLRSCASLLTMPLHAHTSLAYHIRVHTTRVSRLCIVSCFLSLTFCLFICPFFSFSVSLSDNAAKTADLGLLTMSVGRLIRYVGRRALRYSYLPGIRGLHRCLLALRV